jgi:putative transposase
VLLPDHLHCIWTLPPGDADFAARWSLIERVVSSACGEKYRHADWLTESKRKHRESTIWRRRYWEHQIRNESDLVPHVNYVHCNPVKRGLCRHPQGWSWSTIHRYIGSGLLPADWGGSDSVAGGKFGG